MRTTGDLADSHSVQHSAYGHSGPSARGWLIGQLPAALAVTAVVVAMFGLAPQWAVGGGWAAFLIALVLVLLGPVLDLSHWIVDISPFTHSPKLPGGQLAAGPMVWLTDVAAALTVAGPAGAAATSAEQLSPAQPAPR